MQILRINERGTYRAPETLDDAKRLVQDDEIFARARLVNTAFFMQGILGDYVGAILGLVRDGLSWRHDIVARVQAVPAGFPVIWDMAHFDLPRRPAQHAIACSLALPDGAWAIAVNEPSVGRRVAGVVRSRAVEAAVKMMTTAAMLPRRPRFATCDPFHHLHHEVFRATDRLVASGHVQMVGVNYYPHHAIEPLHRVLRAVADRYRLPVMITETGWHDGLHAAHRRFPHIRDRWDWLAHVHAEIALSGVPVAGLCWYPWLDMPAWDNPAHGRWPCGWPGQQV